MEIISRDTLRNKVSNLIIYGACINNNILINNYFLMQKMKIKMIINQPQKLKKKIHH